jgi:signal transduction histidine kinase
VFPGEHRTGQRSDRSAIARGTILIVDDNPDNRSILSRHVTTAGYDALLADGGEEALALLKRESVDLVLMDVYMPYMDGFETCRELRQLPECERTPVVFVTSLGDTETYEMALQSGADDFLMKPVQGVELLLRVQSLLRLRQLNSQLELNAKLLQAQHDDLLRVRAERTKLVAMVAHDLKNPLMAMSLNSSFLHRSVSSEDARQALRDNDDLVNTMQRLVSEMLHIHKSEEGRLEPNLGEQDPAALLHETARLAGPKAQSTQKNIHVEVDTRLDSVHVDASLFMRLLTNLVDNAIKYTPNGTDVEVSARLVDDACWELAVADHGPGIPEEQRSLVFEPYRRLERQCDAEHPRSHGLGLAFCRLAAQAHKGRIWVDPNQPTGTVIRVRLPLRPADVSSPPGVLEVWDAAEALCESAHPPSIACLAVCR